MIRYCTPILLLLLLGLPLHAQTSAELASDIRALRQALEAHRSPHPIAVINTTHNHLTVRHGGRVLLNTTCATGSGKVLLKPNDDERWQFRTPRGGHHIKKKVTNPVWAKPLWAFVESGESAPVLPWEFRRLDPTTLGDYALELGDGYEIHGTLYPTLLGRNITHGCIRLNDEDLAAAYHALEVGDRVYIY